MQNVQCLSLPPASPLANVEKYPFFHRVAGGGVFPIPSNGVPFLDWGLAWDFLDSGDKGVYFTRHCPDVLFQKVDLTCDPFTKERRRWHKIQILCLRAARVLQAVNGPLAWAILDSTSKPWPKMAPKYPFQIFGFGLNLGPNLVEERCTLGTQRNPKNMSTFYTFDRFDS